MGLFGTTVVAAPVKIEDRRVELAQSLARSKHAQRISTSDRQVLVPRSEKKATPSKTRSVSSR
jgi:hypothetical protein